MKYYSSLKDKKDHFVLGDSKIDRFKDLMKFMAKLKELESERTVIYRGQPEAKFMLYNTLQRLWIKKELEKHYNEYSTFISNLINQCKKWNSGLIPRYLKYQGSDDNDISYLSIMQHHGFPTPMLDFTMNPMKSLFFAIENIEFFPSNSEIEDYFSIYFIAKEDSVLNFFEVIENRVRQFQPKNSLSPLFDSLRIPCQKFTINSKSDSLILCESGTKIFVTKNTFVDENGNVPDTIELEIVEAYSISDILRTNLQTVSNGNILQTGGMLFIDAKSNGKPLKINENSSIFIESSSKYFDTRMQLYDGEFQENGHINWANERHLEKTLIAIPLELLDYNFCSWECWYSNKQIEELKNPSYENTFIATREFELRMCMFSSSTCDWANGLDQRIINIYEDNIDKDLCYSDSLVADYIINTYSDKIDTTKNFEFDVNGWFTYMYKSAIDFSKQKLAKPLNFIQLGVTDTTTIDELLTLGYTKSKSHKILSQYRLQKQLIRERNNNQKTQQLVSYAFEVNNLGWINIDALLNVESMKETDFTVEVKSDDSLENISLSLVMPDYNVSIFAIHQDSMRFSFTKKQDEYRKLPINSKAILIGFSYRDGLSYFGKQEIKIPEKGIANLVLKQKDINEIKTEINNLIK